METTQKCLFLVTKVTPHVTDLLTHGTNLLGLAVDLLGQALNFLRIANKTTSLLCDDVDETDAGHIRPCMPSHCGNVPERHCPPHPCKSSTLGQISPG
jgi:hypothetical protein